MVYYFSGPQVVGSGLFGLAYTVSSLLEAVHVMRGLVGVCSVGQDIYMLRRHT